MNTEPLKSMLNNLINDNKEQASLDFHAYMKEKLKDVGEINVQQPSFADHDE